MSEGYKEKPEEKFTDPRRKDGQGLDFWATALLKQGLITQAECDDFIRKNNSKEERLEEKGLPQLEHYGLFDSAEEIREKLSSHGDKRFIIRCTSRESGAIKRLIDASLNEASEFAEALPGGFKKWKVEMKEFADTKISGTIIVDPSGKTIIETWKGPHYLNTENIPKYHAEFDPESIGVNRFRWQSPEGATDLQQYQEYAIKVLRYMFPHLKPKPGEPIYIEYGIKQNGEIYFIEANDSPVVVGRTPKID